MMVKTSLTALLAVCCFSAFAQQRPYYSQYVLNNFILNPAVAGIENYWDAKASHRHQWVGLNGAPVTTYFTINGALTRNGSGRQNPTTVRPQGENPRGQVFLEEYQSTDPHHGVGLSVLNDRTGPINRFSILGSYAYHVPLNDRVSLSGGVSIGIQNVSLRTNELFFGDAYPVDPVVSGSAYINNIRPDINLGLMAYGAKWFAGIGVQQIVPSKVSFNDGKLGGDSVTLLKGKLVPHMFFQAGYRMLLGEDLSLLPSVTLKYVNPVPASFDVNVKLQYRDLLWIGASVRPDDGFAAMLGVNINSSINVGYSYDYTTSMLNTVSKGTHEVVVGFLLGNKYGDWCPRNVW